MIKRTVSNGLETFAKLAVIMWKKHSVNELVNEFSKTMNNEKF